MQKWLISLWIGVIAWSVTAHADQRVVVPVEQGASQASLLDKGFDAAIAQEVLSLVGTPLPDTRLKAVMSVLGPERNTLVSGYSEVQVPEGNATGGSLTMDVRIQNERLKNRLRGLGVMFTAITPQPYVLQLSGIEPSRTKRLTFLQDLTGVKPVGGAEVGLPVLTISQAGAWTGVLTADEWTVTHTGKTLDEVWFAGWKDFFMHSGAMTKGGANLTVRVSGWLSSMGPMEFDRLMDSWTMEIEQKSLAGLEMDGPGMTGVWQVRPRSVDAFRRKLTDAVKAQGLALEIK